MKEVVITAALRTPMGSFNGVFSDIPATRLGAVAIKGLLDQTGIPANVVEEVFMGNVLQAGLGQAPARQAALFAGLSEEVPCTTVNKVCASGMKAVMLAAQSIMLGINEVVVAGGMENMSRVPHYLMDSRKGYKYGNITAMDGLALDGLTDVYNNYMMGNAADATAAEFGISREEQDAFAIESYKRAAQAWSEGSFSDQIVPVMVPQRKGDPVAVSEDEEYRNVQFDKIPLLRPAFASNGTVTAANASTMNDGAAALLLMSADKVQELGLTPIARILGFADAAQKPEYFTTAPAKAIPLALNRAGCSLDQMDLFEINEAFSVVSLVNNRLLSLDPQKVNVHGGAVSLGHPLGASGARILVTLIHALKKRNAQFGAAGICNGGGGASALVLSR